MRKNIIIILVTIFITLGWSYLTFGVVKIYFSKREALLIESSNQKILDMKFVPQKKMEKICQLFKDKRENAEEKLLSMHNMPGIEYKEGDIIPLYLAHYTGNMDPGYNEIEVTPSFIINDTDSNFCEEAKDGELFIYKVSNGVPVRILNLGEEFRDIIPYVSKSTYIDFYASSTNYIFDLLQDTNSQKSILFAISTRDNTVKILKEITPYTCGKDSCPFLSTNKNYFLLSDDKDIYMYDFNSGFRYFIAKVSDVVYYDYEFVGTYNNPDMVRVGKKSGNVYLNIKDILNTNKETIFK